MSWDTEIVEMVRYYIGDLTVTPTYSDENISKMILMGTIQVQKEVDFDTVYVINFDNVTLRPDPTRASARDDSFIWLVTLKTCTIIGANELKIASSQAIAIKDGTSSIDLRGNLDGKKLSLNWFTTQYEDARWKYQLGIRNVGKGVFGPFSIVTPGIAGYGGYEGRDRPLFN